MPLRKEQKKRKLCMSPGEIPVHMEKTGKENGKRREDRKEEAPWKIWQ
ncbi:MAG: hypothetical protein Q4D60_05755 [Eubacteriales bacterium]|nr:hypothetical protein [Eubacteriales bacterium]